MVSGLHADLAAVQIERGIDVARARQHEAFAVVIGDRREIEVVIGLARHAPGRVAREDVDLAALQFLEALAGIERDEFRLARIVENRGRHRAAEIDVEAGPVALLVGDREAGQALVDAAQHLAAAHGALQGPGVVALIDDGHNRDQRRRPRARSAGRLEMCACICLSPIIGEMDQRRDGERMITVRASAGRSPWCRPGRDRRGR